eukprot:gb/GFBE01042937.1/.p1 GENE.gb/GFBE01042937.1/~~gb/GFBE01042937.1/.p1  ORF type:complete len:104 (+),score=25.27 gb/GFBE01042937.1/:1-312(+)
MSEGSLNKDITLVDNQRCGQDNYFSVYLKLKPDFTAELIHAEYGFGGGCNSVKAGTYSVSQEAKTVTCKWTDSWALPGSGDVKHDEQKISEDKTYSFAELKLE